MNFFVLFVKMLADYDEKHLKIRIPSGVMQLGASMTGKTVIMKKLFKFSDEMFYPPPEHKLYCYGEVDVDMNKIYEFESYGAEIHYGLPTFDYLDSLPKPLFVAIDDLAKETKEEYLTELYTRKIHHRNMCVTYASQDYYNKSIRVGRNNAHYLFLTNAPSSRKQQHTLGTQLFPKEIDYFMDALKQTTDDQQYGYLFVNNYPGTPKELRLRNCIFPDENVNVEGLPLLGDVFLNTNPIRRLR